MTYCIMVQSGYNIHCNASDITRRVITLYILISAREKSNTMTLHDNTLEVLIELKACGKTMILLQLFCRVGISF